MACCARGVVWSGVARSRRWRFGPRVVGGRSISGADRLSVAVSRWHPAPDDTGRWGRGRQIRLDTVEATVSIPVSPTTNGPWSEARRALFDRAVRRRTASGARPLVFGGHGPG